jgi:hypothetical protein
VASRGFRNGAQGRWKDVDVLVSVDVRDCNPGIEKPLDLQSDLPCQFGLKGHLPRFHEQTVRRRLPEKIPIGARQA